MYYNESIAAAYNRTHIEKEKGIMTLPDQKHIPEGGGGGGSKGNSSAFVPHRQTPADLRLHGFRPITRCFATFMAGRSNDIFSVDVMGHCFAALKCNKS